MKKTIIASFILVLLITISCNSCRDGESGYKVVKAELRVINIDLKKKMDNITVLVAAAAERSAGLNVKWPESPPKHFWIEDFDDLNEFLEWNVKVTEDCPFHVDALISSAAGEEFEIVVNDGETSLKFASAFEGWDKLEAGVLSLQKGLNTIKLRKLTNKSKTEIKSLELIPESQREGYLQRVADFRNETSWLAHSGYGLMLQYGTWCYPKTGEKKKTLDELAETFDIQKFVALVKETGAAYVIWSLSWWEYQIMMPVEAIDKIVGHSEITASRNFILDLAKELRKNDIRFMLYYHLGHDLHLKEPTGWWKAQKWPAEFAATGMGDREVFFTNWINVITEIGETLGEYLDGWWFDDGLVYYPAPFEKMGKAARSGNPERLVSYNSWISARYTDFQDVYFGEGDHGEVKVGSSPPGGNGIFTTGPQKGLLQHSMFVMEQDWGIYQPNQPINTSVSKEDVIKWVRNASERSVPLSINIMMWEDGSVSDSSLNILKALKEDFRR